MDPSRNRHPLSSSLRPSSPPAQPAGYHISNVATELSRLHASLNSPATRHKDTGSVSKKDLKRSKKQERSSSGHVHHQRRNAARQALSSLIHESGTAGHFGLGLGIQRKNFGLGLDVEAKKNEGASEGLKQLPKEITRQLAKEVPKQVGRYLDGERREGVA
ncbi:hypothetical protein V494_08210, partial [Pseudogymnoascus sp. VKM F-4513 (FW-928)]